MTREEFIQCYEEQNGTAGFAAYYADTQRRLDRLMETWDKYTPAPGGGGLLQKIGLKKPPLRPQYDAAAYFAKLFAISKPPHAYPYTGLWESYRKDDMAHFHTALVQYLRGRAAFRGSLSSGTDHCGYWIEALYWLAAGDEIFRERLPQSLGQSTKLHKLAQGAIGLEMGLVYHDEALLAQSLAVAEKAAAQKSTSALCRAILRYMMALARREPDAAAEQMDAVIKGLPRNQDGSFWEPQSDYQRHLHLVVHGLYNLAHCAWEEELFARLQRPTALFCAEYANWQRRHAYPGAGKAAPYPGELAVLQWMMQALPPVMLDADGYDDAKGTKARILQQLEERGLRGHFEHYHPR